MMKSAALIFITLTASSMFARAEDRVIVEERPAITVPLPIPEISVERRRVEERRTIETDGRGPRGGCETKSITKREPGETKTVTKESCGGGS
jgi:hypothetical protein